MCYRSILQDFSTRKSVTTLSFLSSKLADAPASSIVNIPDITLAVHPIAHPVSAKPLKSQCQPPDFCRLRNPNRRRKKASSRGPKITLVQQLVYPRVFQKRPERQSKRQSRVGMDSLEQPNKSNGKRKPAKADQVH